MLKGSYSYACPGSAKPTSEEYLIVLDHFAKRKQIVTLKKILYPMFTAQQKVKTRQYKFEGQPAKNLIL